MANPQPPIPNRKKTNIINMVVLNENNFILLYFQKDKYDCLYLST